MLSRGLYDISCHRINTTCWLQCTRALCHQDIHSLLPSRSSKATTVYAKCTGYTTSNLWVIKYEESVCVHYLHVLLYKTVHSCITKQRRHASPNLALFTALHRNADAVLGWEFCPSICPSVCLSNACIVTIRKKAMFRLLYHTKEYLS